MENSLSGKVALVTGASSGIGAATAVKLAEAGAKVGIAARRTERLEDLKEEITRNGGEALPIAMDVADPVSVNAGVKKLIDAYGSLHILFNNAGLMPVSDVDQFRIDEWNRMVDVNIKGVLNTTAAALPYMIAQHSGHIINTSSIAGRKVMPGLTVYSATKFAVTAFSEGLRMEVGKKHNIRVTCIQPGAVETELFETTTDVSHRQWLEDYKQQLMFLKASDIADAVMYAIQTPAYVDVAELFIIPTQQM
ncbi:SDR family oxidoreductase [Pectobacterium aroidearum]|uniref:SDR family oxidoreductase n=1 Tax=Pectobacterium aroidearum TaxID=1201031 RepID=UPI0015F04511|nr:SDR family oxidoreductase [Pectobacterium aroidearum]MBA5238950.1 SDR family oxidoreductase [Pectobacterium aroidearum]UUE34647.1 SDR family oxidoreductase [Pectobacterium aroidearum]UUE39024.1 SDR family oxidoreductase [Pectobacterium aroidearum]